MTETTDILEGINAEALVFQQAKARYENAFRTFRSGVKPMDADTFWPMADVFRKGVLKTMLYRQERVGVLAAEEFLLLAAIGESPWPVSAAVHFCLSYGHYKSLAYAGGDACKFGFDRGDDWYGDLMDAVVLLGREFNERLHAGRFYDLPEFSKAVEDLCYASVPGRVTPRYGAGTAARNRSIASRLRVMILRGENYFAMSLEEAAAKRVALGEWFAARFGHVGGSI